MLIHDLTGFQRDLLYAIAGLKEPYGLAIKKKLEACYEKGIHHERLYPNLNVFIEKGSADKDQRDRRTNYYTFARRGHREIKARDGWKAGYVPEDFEA